MEQATLLLREVHHVSFLQLLHFFQLGTFHLESWTNCPKFKVAKLAEVKKIICQSSVPLNLLWNLTGVTKTPLRRGS